jgi:hypothetical protein
MISVRVLQALQAIEQILISSDKSLVIGIGAGAGALAVLVLGLGIMTFMYRCG